MEYVPGSRILGTWLPPISLRILSVWRSLAQALQVDRQSCEAVRSIDCSGFRWQWRQPAIHFADERLTPSAIPPHQRSGKSGESRSTGAAAEGRLNMVDGPFTGNTERTAGAASDGSQHDMDAV